MTSPNNIIKTLPANFKPEDIKFDDLRHMAKDSFPLWCLTSGVEMDNKPIDFNEHRYLLPIYADTTHEIVWQKAAQLGATSYMLLRVLWWLLNHPGTKAGLYFPTKEGVENLSSDRLTPLIHSCPEINEIASDGDKLGLRKIGKSSFYLYHLGGVASKDSVPLDFITFDEVRLCKPQDIDQAQERVSGSKHKVKVFMSTSGMPDGDINARFQLGTQHIWMSKCGCRDGCDLARTFPDCMVTDDPRRPNEVYLRCPKCKYEIVHPQNGRYVPHNPGADFNSYHVSQLASSTMTPKEVWRSFKLTTNMQEFYNAKLGLPYIDEENIGVTKGMLQDSIREDLEWRKPRAKEEKTRTAMGIDQGGGYCYVVIADVNPDGTNKRIRHLEIIESSNPRYQEADGKQVSPFVRCAELMEEFNVGICVCDMMPNYNDALAFAQKFHGRVWLAWYQKDAKDAVSWNDRARTKEPMRKAGNLKFKYTVALSRFLSMSFALGEWKAGDVVMPPTHKLVQMCRDEKTNILGPESPGERFFNMLPRLVKRFHVTNDETGEGRWDWIYAGGDPHFAHAWNYCTVALERQRRSALYSFA